MPNAAFANRPASIGIAIASTPGTVVGSDGVDERRRRRRRSPSAPAATCWSVHAADQHAIPRESTLSALRRHRTPICPVRPVSATLMAHDRNPASHSRGDVCLAALPGRVAVGVCAGAVLRLRTRPKRRPRKRPRRVMKRRAARAERRRCVPDASRVEVARLLRDDQRVRRSRRASRQLFAFVGVHRDAGRRRR